MDKEKECFACSHYRPYYTKGYCTFDRKDFGECSVTKAATDKHHPRCDKFRNKCYGRLTRKLVVKKLDDTLNTLSTLAVMLRESYEEDKN